MSLIDIAQKLDTALKNLQEAKAEAAKVQEKIAGYEIEVRQLSEQFEREKADALKATPTK